MDSPWLHGFFLICTLLVVIPTLRTLVAWVRLFGALRSGVLKWPGPMIHDPNPNVTLGRRNVGLNPDYLFSDFRQTSLAVTGTFFFFLLSFISGTDALSGSIQIRYPCLVTIVTLIAVWAGIININKANYQIHQVDILLTDISSGAEPRHVDGASRESEYAIEHPLLNQPGQDPNFMKALQLFWDGTTYFQSGNQQRGLDFYQKTIELDPHFHEHARDALSRLDVHGAPLQAGTIYYWLGLHSEYLIDRVQAKHCYENAVEAFQQIGYRNRESRAHCNLGNVKMQLMDPSAMDEFEKAVELNPKNGTAYINIGNTYYRISERGDPRFELAMEAYANAIIADPVRFGPTVIAKLKQIGYTWKDDLEDITQRVERKRNEGTAQTSKPIH